MWYCVAGHAMQGFCQGTKAQKGTNIAFSRRLAPIMLAHNMKKWRQASKSKLRYSIVTQFQHFLSYCGTITRWTVMFSCCCKWSRVCVFRCTVAFFAFLASVNGFLCLPLCMWKSEIGILHLLSATCSRRYTICVGRGGGLFLVVVYCNFAVVVVTCFSCSVLLH